MTPNNNFKLSPRIVVRKECSGALLFDPDTGKVRVLNETGIAILSRLDGANSQDSLANKIIEEFDIEDEETVRNDLSKFLDDLKKLNFLEKNES